MTWLNDKVRGLTKGRMDALGLFLFVLMIAWFAGLMLQLFFGPHAT